METTKPIGVFWDIENCPVPRDKSAISLVSKIRECFFKGHTEADFICVCDATKQNHGVIVDLNYAQVTVVHVPSVSKNTSDDKLRQCMQRFISRNQTPATVILITGDVNFVPDLSDLRYRHNFSTILLHNAIAVQALLSVAEYSYCFEQFTRDVDVKMVSREMHQDLLVYNLPNICSVLQDMKVRKRLKHLSSTCRGNIVSIHRGRAIIRFPHRNAALRAQKRMNNEDVFGHTISTQILNNSPSPPTRLPSSTNTFDNQNVKAYYDNDNSSNSSRFYENTTNVNDLGVNFTKTFNYNKVSCLSQNISMPFSSKIANNNEINAKSMSNNSSLNLYVTNVMPSIDKVCLKNSTLEDKYKISEAQNENEPFVLDSEYCTISSSRSKKDLTHNSSKSDLIATNTSTLEDNYKSLIQHKGNHFLKLNSENCSINLFDNNTHLSHYTSDPSFQVKKKTAKMQLQFEKKDIENSTLEQPPSKSYSLDISHSVPAFVDFDRNTANYTNIAESCSLTHAKKEYKAQKDCLFYIEEQIEDDLQMKSTNNIESFKKDFDQNLSSQYSDFLKVVYRQNFIEKFAQLTFNKLNKDKNSENSVLLI